MADQLTVGSASASPGEFDTGWIDGIELTTGERIDIPSMVLNGEHDGPTLLLFSTQHGPEIQGIPVVHEVMRERVTAEELHGALIGVPVGNPLAYMHQTYRSWIDNRDVGAVSVEKPEGNVTQRLAHALWNEAWSQADYVLNFHCVRYPNVLQFTIIEPTPETEVAVERGAEAFGVTVIRREDRMGGDEQGIDQTMTLKSKAAAEGIPHWVPEFSNGRFLDDENRNIGVNGTLNLMREFDLLDKEPTDGPQQGVRVVPCRYTGGTGVNRPLGERDDPRISSWLRSNKGGLLVPRARAGELLEADDPVADVVNVHGKVVETVRMPDAGFVGSFGSAQMFASGHVQIIEEGGQVASVNGHFESE